MARNIAGGSGDVIIASGGPTSGHALTAQIWVYVSDIVTQQWALSWNYTGGSNCVGIAIDSTNYIGSDAGNFLHPTNKPVANVWQHCLVWSGGSLAADDIGVVLNGDWANRATTAGNITYTGHGMLFGYDNRSGSAANRLNGNVAEAALWNARLQQMEIQALAAGARAYTVRRNNLVAYYPLDGFTSPEPDLSGNANNGVLTGTALAFGPPLAPFTPRWPQQVIVPPPPPPPFILMPQIVM
jgi:hypothetical protein